ncbi:uncharacterized protein LOC6583098 isoform X1 [Drosophila mojavensis]|uniref:Uncharacterized protein, isoform B n=1 Tax=Drosophila mojavensis TaxID=7230 RepID=B4L170_DROMO|nr:uncharacterized protein LOC6583098 isoform X1 [Drosophila mojavensis]EDW19252.2 uncharacterized protein Dmoj_GI13680, isoform B [Drosophila mojavensis]
MAKLTLHRLLQRLQLTALQLANDTPTLMRRPQLNNNNNNNRNRMALLSWLHLCHGNGHYYLTLAVLIYGYLMLHASASSTTTNMSVESNLTTITTKITTTEISLAISEKKPKRDVAHVPDDDYDASYPDDLDDLDALINNKSAKGKYIGAPCNELKCDAKLVHVTCDKETQLCSCERNYPVQLGPIKGCAKPKKLGDQCFYDETCIYNDENSLCVQVRHNAMCQCASGFHSVSYTKPTRRVFCTPDLSELSSDLPTLLGVSSGIAVLAGLICMVLHLFSKTKYPRHRNFGDANIPPPILYSSDTGIPLTVHSARPSSRSSIRSTGSIGSFGNRRASSGGLTGAAGGGVGNSSGGGGGGGGGGGSGSGGHGGNSKGILVSTSRTGAARSAAILLISCHITAVSKQNSRASSRHTSGAGCSQHSRDNLDENNGCNGSGSAGAGGGSSAGGCRSCESTLSMNRQLQKQLNHQRHLLSFELSPAKTKNQDRFRTLLGLNGIHNYDDDDDNNDDGFNSIDALGASGAGSRAGVSGYGGYGDYGSGIGGGAELHHLQIGALPTPASETPRFAVNQLISQQSFSVNHQHPHQHQRQSQTITIGQFVASINNSIPPSNYVFSL